MQDFQTVWSTTATGGAAGDSGDVSVTSTGGQDQGGDHRERGGVTTSTTVDGQGPVFDLIDSIPFTEQEVRLLLDAAHVGAVLLLAYLAIKEN